MSEEESTKINQGKEEKNDNSEGMTFVDHLSELRKRLMLAVVGLLIGMFIAAFFVEYIMNIVLLSPAIKNHLKIQNLKPFGQPILYFKIIFIAGLIISIPWLIYQLWKFIAPALYQKEKRWVLWITFSASFSFLSGIVFSYFVMLPSMVNFAANFGNKAIDNIIDVNEYISFYTTMMLGSGLVFELPILTFILAKIGLVNSKFLRKYWRHSIIVILFIAAIVTPTPDPVNQLVFAVPLIVLYEVSIWVAKAVEKNKRAKADLNSTAESSAAESSTADIEDSQKDDSIQE
jgi:sec-independent protein translocase protein TatC